jgi:O-antigen/teichoic acid export membrane protein
VLPRLAAVMVGAAILGALLAGPAVLLLFGAEFAPAVAPLRLLMPAVLLLSVNSVLMNYLASSGMPPVTVYSPAAATVVNVALNLWLIPRLGGTGAAVSSLVAYACMLAFSVAYLRRERRRRAGG